MKPTTISLHTDFQIAAVDPRLFGGFLEHLGRAVYGGVYEPGCPDADDDGFRTDVMDALRRLGMTAMRYPGGNFASGYHWTDGVGPSDRRPAVRDLAWKSIETNAFGTDEYVRLCRKMGWTPMLTVNLGTGPAEEARNWLEYCNSPRGTKYADMRAAGGSARPHDVKLWCLGNEMDGPWQLGHVPAEQYAIRARQAAKMMKDLDASVELVASGSSGPFMDTYVQWDRAVLENLGDLADYISLHRYVGNTNDDTADYLAVTNGIDRQIEEVDAVCRCAQARRKSNKRAYLCFDEWNVWYKNHVTDGRWRSAPALLEETYNLEDALVVAGFLHSFVRHADSVKIANLAQIVNVIAPVLVRGRDVLIQSIFYPFEMFSRRRSGVALRTAVGGPTYEGKTNGRVNTIDASAILDGARLHVFVTNRDLCDPAEVSIRPAGPGIARLVDAEILTAPEPKSSNSFEDPAAVASRTFEDVAVTGGAAVARLPRLSLAAMTFELG